MENRWRSCHDRGASDGRGQSEATTGAQQKNGEERAEGENREEMREKVRWADVEDDGCFGGEEVCKNLGGSIRLEMHSEDEQRDERQWQCEKRHNSGKQAKRKS